MANFLRILKHQVEPTNTKNQSIDATRKKARMCPLKIISVFISDFFFFCLDIKAFEIKKSTMKYVGTTKVC